MSYAFIGNEETITINEQQYTVRRIQFNDGRLGGRIQSRFNLNSTDNLFIDEDTVIVGRAKVSGNGTKLENTTMTNGVIYNGEFKDCTITNCEISGGSFDTCIINGGVVTGGNWVGCNIDGGILRESNGNGATINGGNYYRCLLNDGIFSEKGVYENVVLGRKEILATMIVAYPPKEEHDPDPYTHRGYLSEGESFTIPYELTPKWADKPSFSSRNGYCYFDDDGIGHIKENIQWNGAVITDIVDLNCANGVTTSIELKFTKKRKLDLAPEHSIEVELNENWNENAQIYEILGYRQNEAIGGLTVIEQSESLGQNWQKTTYGKQYIKFKDTYTNLTTTLYLYDKLTFEMPDMSYLYIDLNCTIDERDVLKYFNLENAVSLNPLTFKIDGDDSCIYLNKNILTRIKDGVCSLRIEYINQVIQVPLMQHIRECYLKTHTLCLDTGDQFVFDFFVNDEENRITQPDISLGDLVEVVPFHQNMPELFLNNMQTAFNPVTNGSPVVTLELVEQDTRNMVLLTKIASGFQKIKFSLGNCNDYFVVCDTGMDCGFWFYDTSEKECFVGDKFKKTLYMLEEGLREQIQYNSSNTNIAIVDNLGNVTAMGAGQCFIEATFNNVVTRYPVKVLATSNKLTITYTKPTLTNLYKDFIPDFDIQTKDILLENTEGYHIGMPYYDATTNYATLRCGYQNYVDDNTYATTGEDDGSEINYLNMKNNWGTTILNNMFLSAYEKTLLPATMPEINFINQYIKNDTNEKVIEFTSPNEYLAPCSLFIWNMSTDGGITGIIPIPKLRFDNRIKSFLPYAITRYFVESFESINRITDFELPSELEYIHSFNLLTGINPIIKIPHSVKLIGAGVLERLSGTQTEYECILTDVYLPKSLVEIGGIESGVRVHFEGTQAEWENLRCIRPDSKPTPVEFNCVY